MYRVIILSETEKLEDKAQSLAQLFGKELQLGTLKSVTVRTRSLDSTQLVKDDTRLKVGVDQT